MNCVVAVHRCSVLLQCDVAVCCCSVLKCDVAACHLEIKCVVALVADDDACCSVLQHVVVCLS